MERPIRTGVISEHSLSEFALDGDYIDLDFERHCEECPNQDHVTCYCEEGSERLYGSWKKNEAGQYEPDTSGQFAAIYRPDFAAVQIVWSRYVSEGRCLCFPCFSTSVDLDTVKGYMLAYTLPGDYLSERYIVRHGLPSLLAEVKE